MAEDNDILVLVAGDRKPSLVHTIKAGGSAVDLNAVSNVFFRLTNMKTSVVALADVTATITDATNGIVTYNWAAGDTSVAGMYTGDWLLTYSTGEDYHIKNPFRIAIREP